MPRPVVKLVPSAADRLLDRLAIVLLLLLIAGTVYSYFQLPDIIPIHFDAAGNPDSYGNKATLFLLPGIAILMFLFISYINTHPEWFNYAVQITAENAREQYSNACRMLRLLKVSIMLIFLIIVACSYLVATESLSKLPAGIIFIIIGLAVGPVLIHLIRSSKKQ